MHSSMHVAGLPTPDDARLSQTTWAAPRFKARIHSDALTTIAEK